MEPDRTVKVVFDAQPLLTAQKTGVGYYTEGLIKGLAKQPNIRLVGHYWRQPGVNPASLPKSPNLSYIHSSWLSSLVYRSLRKCGLRLPRELFIRQRADIFLFPNFTSWPGLIKTFSIIVIHDLAFLDCPQFVRRANLRFLRRYVPADIDRAALVLSASKFTKGRLISDLHISPNKILTTPIPPATPVVAKKSAQLPKNFILFISTIEPRKNLRGLVSAYELFPKAYREKYSLVIAGGNGWDSGPVLSYIKNLQFKGYNISLTGYVDESTRAALYSQAEVIVVPSFYEGLGMPILEAMSYGVPAAVSDIPVFREVAGGAATYFDPSSPESIKNCLIKLLSDKKLRQQLVKMASVQRKLYDWDKVSTDVFRAMVRLVKSG